MYLYSLLWLHITFSSVLIFLCGFELPFGATCLWRSLLLIFLGFLCSWRSFSSAFKIFLLVLFFQNFYYGISVCISFCVYPIWTSVSFWMCWLLFFNTLGKFIDIISLKFFLLLFLFSGTPGVCMLVCVMMFHFLWGSIHFPPSFLLCFSACANSIFKFTHSFCQFNSTIEALQ